MQPLIRATGTMRSAGTSLGRGTSGTGGPRSRTTTRDPPTAEAVIITQTNVSGDSKGATATAAGQEVHKRPRRRLSPDSADIPSLKEFVHRQAVIRQYRGFLRAVNCIPDPAFQSSSKREVRESFGRHKDETDALSVQMALKEGERQLEQVRSMVGYVSPDDAAKTHDDSWLNINDEEDPRGRVGVMWPWEQNK